MLTNNFIALLVSARLLDLECLHGIDKGLCCVQVQLGGLSVESYTDSFGKVLPLSDSLRTYLASYIRFRDLFHTFQKHSFGCVQYVYEYVVHLTCG